MIYEPRGDSFLMQRNIRAYAKGLVCDMGTGSGILAREAAKYADKVFAVDINPEAIQKDSGKIRFIQSDLFTSLGSKKFDLIIFNPPYLPDDPKVKDIALDGGKHGYELIARFLDGISGHMAQDGKILLLFSSFTKKDKVQELIRRECLDYQQIDLLNLDFETLFVYLIEKSALLAGLEKKGVKKICILAKGHRGVIFTGLFGKKKICIKAKNPVSEAVGRIRIEADMLKVLNKHNIGPKLQFFEDSYFACSFVEGDLILDHIIKSSRKQVISTLQDVLEQLLIMDKLGIDKEEMHHPIKHIIVGKKPVMIDFERAHYTKRPKNITQFIEFLSRIQKQLEEKSIHLNKQKLILLAREYSKARDPRPIMEYVR